MSILKPFPFLDIETWKSGTLFFFFLIIKKILPLQEKQTHTQNSENEVWTQKHTTNYTQKS